MTSSLFRMPATIVEPLEVIIVEREIVISGAQTATPSLTPAAARLTGLRLIAAANRASGQPPASEAGRRGH